MVFSLNCTAFALESQSESENVLPELADMLCETGYVLVEDGQPRVITEAEYESLVTTEESEIAPAANFYASINKNENNSNSVSSSIPSYYYLFTPTTTPLKVYLSTKYRVSDIYVSADTVSISISATHTESRTVTSAGGLTLSSTIKDAIFSGVSATYSYSTSATSSTSQSVTGVMNPKSDYTYSAVFFQPRVTLINGTLKYYQVYQGLVTELTSVSAQAQYPCSLAGNSGVLDGIYSVRGANYLSYLN